MKKRHPQIVLPYSKSLEHDKHSFERPCAFPETSIRHTVDGIVVDYIANKELFKNIYRVAPKEEQYAHWKNVASWSPLRDDTPCPYCNSYLSKSDEIDWSNSGGGSLERYEGQALSCEICGWWVFQIHHRFSAGGYDSLNFTTYEGIVYQFDISGTELPITAIRREILKKGFAKTPLSPKELELLVGSVMRDYFHCRVKHVGGPGDGGIDLLLLEAENPVIVQVKCLRNPKKKVSVSVIRDLLGSMLLASTNRGIIASISSDFTKPAKEAAIKAKQICAFDIDLYNQERIRDILKITTPPEKPWTKYIPEEIKRKG